MSCSSSESLCSGRGRVVVNDDDDELEDLQQDQAEAWSITVHKSTLQAMSARDIKRQDHIWGD